MKVETLEQQPPANPRLFHTRLSAALSLSVFFSVYMLLFCVGTVLQQARPNMMVMFAFEFAVLTVLSLSTTARYALSLYEIAMIKRQIAQGRERLRHRTENPLSDDEANGAEIDTAGWEEKGQWIFYLDIATDFFKLVLYLAFFCVLCMFYGMPIHIIRDVALTVRSFYKRIRDFIQYKQATKDMNARYPDATAEEIQREDVCIICRENMTVWQDSTNTPGAETPQAAHQPIDERQRAKKLPCGHLLHFACLRSWLERQQICPTCRMPVLGSATESSNPAPAAGPPGQAAPVAGPPPAVEPHVYTFGPFRLVLGARHMNNNPLQNPAGAGPLGANPSAMLQNRNPAPQNSASIHAQLSAIEQQLSRDISSLTNLADQVQVVRALQAELARLQASQGLTSNVMPMMHPQSRQASAFVPQQTLQAYRQVPLTLGQREFPTGLTIPDNWTLHALQRIPGSAHAETPMRHRVNALPHAQQAVPAIVQGRPDQDLVSASSVPPSASQSPGATGTSTTAAMSGATPSAQNRDQPPTPAEPATSCCPEAATPVPQWGSAVDEEMGMAGRSTENNPAIDTSKHKGKGRAATVEDGDEDEAEAEGAC
ncbi:MAG: hypothetical protein Q9222_005689 [Ikaeria aurantiellina]